MAKFEVYGGPKVDLQAAPSVGGPRAIDNGAQYIAQGISAVGDAVQREVDRLDKIRVQDAVNNLETLDAITRPKITRFEGRKALEPVDGESPFLPVENEYKDGVATIAKGLTPRQQAMFDQIAKKHYASLGAFTAAHQGQEQTRYEKGVKLETFKHKGNALDAALATGNKDLIARATADYNAAASALNDGIPVDEANREAVSKRALNAVADKVNNKQVVGGETGPFAELFNNMTDRDKSAALALSHKGDLANKALAISTNSYHQDMTEVEAATLAKKQAGGDAELYDALKARYDQEIKATDNTMKERAGEYMGDVQLRVNEGNVLSLINEASTKPELNKKYRGSVVTWLKSQERAYKAEREGGADTRKANEILFAATVSRPGFGDIPREKILEVMPEYGSFSGRLFSAWQQASAEGGRIGVPTPVKNLVMQASGLNPKNQEDMLILNNALVDVSTSITKEYRGKAKPTDDEIYRRAMEVLTPITVERRNWIADVEKPLVRLTTEDIKKVNASIPAHGHKLIARFMEEKGMPATERGKILAWQKIENMRLTDKEAYTVLWNESGINSQAR